MPFSFEFILLGAAILVLLSVTASRLSDKFAVPALIFFILMGILAGREGVGGVVITDIAAVKALSMLALVVIIFTGGLDTDFREIRSVIWSGMLLATAGVLLTAILVAVFAVVLFHFTVLEGVLLGAIVSATDAAAVFAVLRTRHVNLKGTLRPLLEFESSSNDPMAVFLTVFALSAMQITISPAGVAKLFAIQMLVGFLVGWLMARGSLLLVRHLRIESSGLYPALTLSILLITFSSAELLGGSGILAAYVLGLLMAREDFLHKKAVKQFYEGLAWIVQILVFLILGLLVVPSKLPAIFLQGVLLALFLMLVARPVSVFLSLLPFKIGMNKKFFISWVGLRGAAPVVLATFPLLAGIPKAVFIFDVVFVLVVVSVLVQGTSIPWAARVLGVDTPSGGRRRSPIQFEKTEAFDADLTEILVPYRSACIGQAIVDLKMSPESLIVLITRNDRFVIPSGATVIEEGDVLLVLAGAKDLMQIRSGLFKLKKELL